MNNISKYRMTSYVCLLIILMIVTFLVAKYIVRSGIDDGEIPIDTSTRL